MSTLARLERQMKLKREQAPPPASSGLGEAIERLIAEQVEERVAEQMEKQNSRVPPYLREFTNKAEQHEFPPPTPQRQEPRDLSVQLFRDENGRAARATVGNVNFIIQRDSQGRAVRMIQVED